jgi:hypothetical protein
LFLAAGNYEASISYFSRSRPISISRADKQNYIVVDGDIWKFSRNDLGDLRIYDGTSQVPYAFVRAAAGSSTQEKAAKIFNLGSVAGRTEFDLEIPDLTDYGRVRLELDAKNFINIARVEGRRAVNDRSGTELGNSTLYDFTAEGLGSNFVLKFPSSSFPYLHVRLAPGIKPTQVKHAYVSSFSETKAAWSQAGECNAVAGGTKETVFECAIQDRVPVERLTFDLPTDAVNFNRTVIVTDETGNEIARSSISRVRMTRTGQTVVSEDLSLDLFEHVGSKLKLKIENGDDRPLPIAQVRPLSIQRRIYFDPVGKSALQLYYGDPKLESPSYDFAKFFQQGPTTVSAALGAPTANPQYAGRPDERPWSERHQALLWLAMIAAVALLGAMAVRSFKESSTAK